MLSWDLGFTLLKSSKPLLAEGFPSILHPSMVMAWDGGRGAALCPLFPSSVLTPWALRGSTLQPVMFGKRWQWAQPKEQAREGEALGGD